MHKNMHDSIFTTESQKNYQLLQTQFETAQKERKIQELKNIEKLRKARERVVYLAGVSLTIVLISIILVVLLKRRKDKLIHIQKERLLEKEKALVQSNLEKSQLKEQELNTQLEYKSKQLTSHALNMMQKNKFLQEVEKDVAEISKKSGDETKDKLRMLNRSIKRMNKSDKDWELFRNYFEEVNTGFYQRLGERFTGLSGNDYKLLALIKLNMNIKETASVLNISPDSVKTARYRLRKKLGLKQDDDLYEFVAGV
jgi:DNA-binding CsgD family transcriptional regulator/tellurite resistance protein